MEILQEWQVLWVPAAVLIISQFIKMVVEAARGQGFHLSHLNSYGGMPSTHTALFTSVAVIVGLEEGFTSPLFMLAFFTAVAFIRDAVGIRFALGYHGKILNHILANLPEDVRDDFPKKLNERLGHTNAEAFAGFLLGVVLTALLHVAI